MKLHTPRERPVGQPSRCGSQLRWQALDRTFEQPVNFRVAGWIHRGTRICGSVEECHDHVIVASARVVDHAPRCLAKGCSAPRIDRFQRSILLEQDSDNSRVPTYRRQMQRCLALMISRAPVHTAIEQKCHHVQVSVQARMQKACLDVGIPGRATPRGRYIEVAP